MTTSHSLLSVLSHKANIVPARLRADETFRDALLERLHSVSCQYNRDLQIRMQSFFIAIFYSEMKDG